MTEIIVALITAIGGIIIALINIVPRLNNNENDDEYYEYEEAVIYPIEYDDDEYEEAVIYPIDYDDDEYN